MRLRVAPLVLILTPLVACNDAPQRYADWIAPLPLAAAKTIEYPGVAYEDRAGRRIEAAEDLVLGSSTDPQQAFYIATGVVSDDAGNIFVLDAGNDRLQMFDRDGAYLRTLGRRGPGPGEFAGPSDLTINAGGIVLLAEEGRLSTWTLAGAHVEDRRVERLLFEMHGFGTGFVARYWHGAASESDDEPHRISTFAAFDPHGDEVHAFIDIEEPPPMRIRRGDNATVSIAGGGLVPDWATRGAVAADGTLYVTTSREYQVHAYGGQPWSLRVAWPREPVTRRDIDAAVARFTDGPLADVDLSAFDWPDRFGALVNIAVDGHGHLYVFPFHRPLHEPLPSGHERPALPRPVDVYSAAGELLFTGTIGVGDWMSSRGDFVYDIRANPVTDETEVVRYRLTEPF